MIFGAPLPGGGLSGSRRTLVANEGALSERMRDDHNIKEKNRVEKERAKEKFELEDRKLRHNKLELSSRESDLRRFTNELTRADLAATEAKRVSEDSHHQIAAAKEEVDSLRKHIEETKALLARLTNDMHHAETEYLRLSSVKSQKELEAKRREAAVEKLKENKFHVQNEIQRLHSDIARGSQDMTKLEATIKH